MAKRRRETDTHSVVTTATCSTVFIDTSLDTHLAMIVSDSDTVSDLKKKVTFEHLQCFPKLGEIKIHALKVKRKGHFYHLSDSMLVKSAFEEGKRNWFVSVDASSLKQQSENQHSCKSDASNPLALVCFPNNPSGESSLQKLVSTQCTNQKIPNADHSSPKDSKDVDIEVKDITSDDADRRSDIKIQEKYEVISERAKVAATSQKNDNSRNGLSRAQCNNSLEQSLETTHAGKNKRKIKRHNDEVVHDGGLKDNIASNQTSRPETVGPSNSLVSAGKEVSNDMEMGSKDVNEEDSHSRPAAKKKRKIESNECSRNPLELGSGEKNIKRKGKYVLLSLNDQTLTFVPPVQDVVEERSFNENVENNHKDFCNEKLSELIQEVVERNNVTCSSISTDMRETDAGNVKGNSGAPELDVGLNEGGADVAFKEPVLSAKLSNVKVAIESGDYDGSKRKKKRVKRSAIRNQNSTGMEQANNAMSGIALTVLQSGTNHHFSDKTKKDESISSHPKCKEVPEQKSIDGSSSGTGREDDIMIGNEVERFPLTQKNNELSLNHDAEQMLSERAKERAVESGKVDGTKKKVKRVKKSAARNQDVSNLKHANNVLSGGFSQTAPNSAINGHSSDKMKKDESVLSHVEREEASQHKSVDTSFVASDRECDNMSGNETESLPLTQVNRSKENADNVDAKSGKKFRKGRISTPKLLSDFLVKEQEHVVESLQLNEVEKNQDTENMDIRLKKKTRNNQKSAANSRPDLPIRELGVDELTASNDKLRDEDTPPSKTTKERRSVKTSPVNQLTGSGLERKKNTGVEPEPEAKTDRDEHMEVSKGEGDEINFKHYFVPGQEENEFAPVDKLKEDRRPDGEMKAKKNKKKPGVSSLGTSPDLRNTDRSYENQGARKKSSIKSTISNQPQESLSKDEDNEVMPPPKKSLKVSGYVVKTGTDVSFHGTSTPAAAYKKGNNELLSASRSSPQSSDRSLHSRRDNKCQPDVDTYHAAVRKGSTKNTGQGEDVRKASTEAKNSSQHEKSLLATPGAIFSDDSSDSSADENRSVNSDTSTRTPSHNSSSSGSSLDSPRNGSYDTKRKEGGKNIMKSQSAGPKNITMDMIFRSSSRFKKAKLTALGDSESQPVDFVPDSQANM